VPGAPRLVHSALLNPLTHERTYQPVYGCNMPAQAILGGMPRKTTDQALASSLFQSHSSNQNQKNHPGEGRGPIGEAAVTTRRPTSSPFPNWAPASAGVVPICNVLPEGYQPRACDDQRVLYSHRANETAHAARHTIVKPQAHHPASGGNGGASPRAGSEATPSQVVATHPTRTKSTPPAKAGAQLERPQ
jgi:hypothetical protein